VTSGKAADLLSQLDARVSALEALTAGVLCPAGDADACPGCREHRNAAAYNARIGEQRAQAAQRRREADARLEQYWRDNPPDQYVKVTCGARPVATAGVVVDIETAERLGAMGATFLSQTYEGATRVDGLQLVPGGYLIERADRWRERVALDPQIAHALHCGHLHVVALGEAENREHSLAERDLVRSSGLMI
jgi:hypothetical protein